MNATAIPRAGGNDGDHAHGAIAIPVPPSAAVDHGASCYGPRRRKRSGTSSVKAAALLLLICGGSAAVLTLKSKNPTAAKAAFLTGWSTLQQRHLLPSDLQASLSATLDNLPRMYEDVLEGTKASAASIKAFSAESTEVAWEKSEDAFHQLRDYASLQEDEKEGGSKENPLERALEGLEGIFHLRKHNGGAREERNNNGRNNNLRIKEGRNNNNNSKQRNLKKEKEANSRGGNNNHHRNAKAEPQGDAPEVSSEGEYQSKHETIQGSITSLLSKSPLASPLLAFCALVFLAASFVLNAGGGRNESIVLDENEAEIVEFYEKEMECGTLQQTVPFVQNNDQKGQGELLPIRWASERNLSDSSLVRYQLHHSRSSSDSDLVRHPSESRESQCDLYYSRVLQDIETLDYEDDEAELAVEEPISGEIQDSSRQEDPQVALIENISLPEEEVGLVCPEDADTPALPHCQLVAGEEDGDTSFESAQCEMQGEAPECPQDPPSTCSSISSLTSESYDIEAPFGGPSFEEEEKKEEAQYRQTSPIDMSGVKGEVAGAPLVPTRSLSRADSYSEHVSSTAITPPISNLCKERPTSLVKKESRRAIERRVSFHSQVQVREIPRVTAKRHQEISSESYLYIMLFAVAIAIAVFSVMPAHPSLSPMYPITREDVMHRAGSMLSSQWDVEL